MKEAQWKVLALLIVLTILVSATPKAATRVRLGVGVSAHHPNHRVFFTTHYRTGIPFHHHRYYGTRVIRVSPRNAGRVDFNIKPSQSQVFVDGAYIGVADDYNGGFFGETATLKAGKHRIKVVSPEGQVVHREIYVMPGKELNFDLEF